MSTASTDRDLSVRFLVTSPAAMIQDVLKLLPADRAERQVYYLVYEAGEGYVALRWCDVETLAAGTLGPDGVFDKAKPLSSLPGLPTQPNARLNPASIADLALDRPVVLVAGGRVVAVLVDDRWATPGPERDPFVRRGGTLGGGVLGGSGVLGIPTPPPAAQPESAARGADPNVERELNAWVDDYDGKQPMGVGNVYQLMFDVAPKRADALLVPPESAVKAKNLFQTGVDQIELSITVVSDDFTIWGSDNEKLVVLRDSDSKGVASFNIEPKHEGLCRLDAVIFLGDNHLQTWTFTFQAGPYQAGKKVVNITSKGFALDSASKLNQRRSDNTVNIVISDLGSGYSSVVIGGVRITAKLGLNAQALDELLKRARDTLRGIVYLDSNEGAPYSSLSTIDVPPAIHQESLNKLAEIGVLLYQRLFFDSPDENTTIVGNLLRDQKSQLRIQIAAENFIFPWTLLYDKELEDNGNADWQGFWGFKHIVEYVPSAPGTVISFNPQITVLGKLPLIFVANEHIDTQMHVPLIAGQKQFFATLAEQIDLVTQTSKAEMLANLRNADLSAQVLYLYCHAHSALPGEGQGTGQSVLMIDDLIDTNGLTVETMTIRAGFNTRLKSAPLVYLNACQGAQMSALLYAGLVPYLVRKGARGVIGTEVDTPALFAAEFAKRFFQRFIVEGVPLGQLMLELRREFVEQHNNIMGLVYSLYSNGEVCVVRE